jgi:4-alpha-glucanotransferase
LNLKRSAGVLVAVTSLPGEGGVGDLGAPARGWLDWLHAAGCSLWQMLPITRPGFGWSPYQAVSSFAGSPLLISLSDLVTGGWLQDRDAADPRDSGRVDYEATNAIRSRILDTAVEDWRRRGRPGRERFEAWCSENREWLDDFAMFMALKGRDPSKTWTQWDPEIARREPDAVDHARRGLGLEIEGHRLQQYWFWSQWADLRAEAARLGVRLIGDLPIYTAHDSADVWANPRLFKLDPMGECAFVGGVPPDYFSKTGQRWDTPVYDWERNRQEDFRWWKARVRKALATFDAVRLDHFRGFEAYWEIPAGSASAEPGRWVIGPGAGLFDALEDELGEVALYAEDLGVITPEVNRLRDEYGLPGMRVLQFDLDTDQPDPDLAQTYRVQTVAVTGTHDNNTSAGWLDSLAPARRERVLAFLGKPPSEAVEGMIDWLWSSPAAWALAPLQDILGLGGDARMNLPGTADGNWRWRASPNALTEELADRMRTRSVENGRIDGASA